MIKRGHDIYALAFLILYIYTIFAQIGYAYFPELSILIGAYFGPMLFYKYWAFMFFSFFFSFFLYKKMIPINKKKYTYLVKSKSHKLGGTFFFLIVILLYLILNLYFIKNRGLFGWGGGSPMGSQWFTIGFKIFGICAFIVYTLFRDTSNQIKKRRFSFIIFLICFLFYLKVAIAAGTRSDILYFFVAISFYELSPVINTIKYQKKKIFLFMVSGFFLVSMLVILLNLRTQVSNVDFSSFVNAENNDSGTVDKGLVAAFLLQDYYGPSHTLFVSMHHNIIDPIEVFKSNFANSLVKFKYPYLSTTIVEKVGSRSERGAGWSYHYFVEGYNALGLVGVFYNALFWNLGMLLWTKLAQSNNGRHNKAMLSILALIIMMAMRGQTAAFIQFYWMILLPSLWFLLLANNSKILILKRIK
tara:strand:+ start:8537 stop:9781 length:1245 start_codon:yes stop_codon:yes gene_type:complete